MTPEDQQKTVEEITHNDRPQRDGTYRVLCMCCGKSVSSPLSGPVVVRAWVICPECIEKHGVDGGRAKT